TLRLRFPMGWVTFEGPAWSSLARLPEGSHSMPRLFTLTVAVWLALTARVPAQEPLHERIDRRIMARPEYAKQAAAPADDAEFLRRVSLDLAGVIPTTADARQFLNDQAPDKRAKLIDRLLAGPHYARHMANVFD